MTKTAYRALLKDILLVLVAVFEGGNVLFDRLALLVEAIDSVEKQLPVLIVQKP